MKKLTVLTFSMLLCIVMLSGCAGFQITDTSTNKAMAYVSGKGMGIGINELVPEVDEDLTTAWVRMMDRNAANEFIPPDEMVMYFNDSISMIAMHTNDPLGLIGDLAAFTMLYGAGFDVDGNMTGIQPVPMAVMRFFESGYANGRRVALRD